MQRPRMTSLFPSWRSGVASCALSPVGHSARLELLAYGWEHLSDHDRPRHGDSPSACHPHGLHDELGFRTWSGRHCCHRGERWQHDRCHLRLQPPYPYSVHCTAVS
eukprot:scaffold186232_cov30-Tisochrysis_lutea.AAC.1